MTVEGLILACASGLLIIVGALIAVIWSSLTKRIDDLTLATSEHAVNAQRLLHVEQDVEEMHRWKNNAFPDIMARQTETLIAAIRRIEDAVERRLDQDAKDIKEHEKRITLLERNGKH